MSEEGLTNNAAPLASGEAHPGDPPSKPVNAPVVPSGTEIVQGDYIEHDRAPKRSHVCCGCCCDTRTAVTVVNTISLSFGALAVASLAVASSSSYQAQKDDDEFQAAMDELDGAKVGMAIFIVIMGMVFHAFGIYGATKYNKIGVLVAGVWYALDAILRLVYLDFGGAIMDLCFAYPHAMFYNELKQGIMTPEQYPHERQCCTCCD